MEIKRKRRALSLLAIVIISCLATGCSKTTKPLSHSIFAMDTVMDVTIYGDEEQLRDIENIVYSIEDELSVTNATSAVYQLNTAGSLVVDMELASLVTRSLDLCKETDGALDITIYPVSRAWGFTRGQYQVPDTSELNRLLANVDYNGVSTDICDNQTTIRLKSGKQVDFGSVAKGYAADRIVEYMASSGISGGLINLGGNVHTYGTKPDGSLWKIGIANPENVSEYVGYLELTDRAVVTSGGYQRYFEQDGKIYHHIINPATGYPADNDLASVSVIGESGFMCDGLSTALFVMGLDEAINYWRDHGDFELVLVDKAGNVYITKGLERIFTSGEGVEVNIIY